jgi:uncharacterized membrane protein YfcA
MDIDWLTTLWSALVVLVATTVHGIAGFGTGQIGLPPLQWTGESDSLTS